MPLVIATKRLFLVCEDIISITVQEGLDENNYAPDFTVEMKKRLGRLISVSQPTFQITVFYSMTSNPGYQQQITISLNGQNEANSLYREIVRAIREQKPDMLYLDNLIEEVLGSPPLEAVR